MNLECRPNRRRGFLLAKGTARAALISGPPRRRSAPGLLRAAHVAFRASTSLPAGVWLLARLAARVLRGHSARPRGGLSKFVARAAAHIDGSLGSDQIRGPFLVPFKGRLHALALLPHACHQQNCKRIHLCCWVRRPPSPLLHTNRLNCPAFFILSTRGHQPLLRRISLPPAADADADAAAQTSYPRSRHAETTGHHCCLVPTTTSQTLPKNCQYFDKNNAWAISRIWIRKISRMKKKQG